MNAPKLIMFDMDGTLIDSQHVIVAAMDQAFAAVGLMPPAREATLAIVGLSLAEAMEELRPGLSPETVSQLVDAYKNGFVAQRQSGEIVPLYDGALACLHRLHAVPEAVLGVATGKAVRGVNHTVESHNLHGMFTTVQTADTNPSKPHPAMLETACAQTGIAPKDAVMIGDTSFDLDMGRAAGLATIAVTWGYHARDRLVASGPDRIVDSFAGLEDAIEDIMGVRACLTA